MTWLRWVLVAAAVLKTVDAGPVEGLWWLALLWASAATATALQERAGLGLMATVAFGVSLAGYGSNHVVLIGWVAAALALFTGDRRLLVLRVQTVVLYGFAVANKLNGDYLAGEVLANHALWVPGPLWLAASAAVAVEAWLAAAVWRRWRSAVPVAAGFHAVVVATMSTSLALASLMVIFNGLALALVAVTTREAAGQSCRTATSYDQSAA